MTPNEINILKIVEVENEIHRAKLSHRMKLASHYIGYLCECLIRVGFLEEAAAQKYKITKKGTAALIQEFFEVKVKLDGRIERLSYLRDGAVREIERIGKTLKAEEVSYG